MNAEVKEKWVKALRSGRYKQTTGGLEYGGEHCCLGVLCRVVRLPRSVWEDESELTEFDEGRELMARIGLTEAEEVGLISRNDGLEAEGISPHDFSEIADYIEANL